MSEIQAQAEGLSRFPCRQCGASLEFAPGTTVLKCPYCSAENQISVDHEPVREQDFQEYLRKLEEAAPQAEVRVVKCGSCAAEVTPPPNVTSFACPYCGANIVAESRACRIIPPQGVVPFKITRDGAADLFRGWVKSRWFAPNALKRQAIIEAAVSGLYMPAWTYDSFVRTAYTGERGDAYYVTVGSGSNRRTERRIRWSSASGVVQNRFDDVLVVATRTLPSKLARELEPWDLTSVVAYEEEFLAGFRAERYSIGLREGWGIAIGLMQPTIDATIRSDIGGDEQRINSKQSSYSQVTFKHLLLPVWISAYRYKAKVYQFLVNARTGEVQGDRPYSPWKIGFAVLLGLIVVGTIVYIVATN